MVINPITTIGYFVVRLAAIKGFERKQSDALPFMIAAAGVQNGRLGWHDRLLFVIGFALT